MEELEGDVILCKLVVLYALVEEASTPPFKANCDEIQFPWTMIDGLVTQDLDIIFLFFRSL